MTSSNLWGAWPLILAFAVLFGSLAAVATTILGVEAPDWFTSVWLWIPALAVTAVALLMATERSSERLRRRMKNALVLSLLAHLVLAIYLKDQFLAFVSAPKELDETVQVEPLPTLPQFYFRPPDSTETTEAFEQPVTTSAPQVSASLQRLEPDVDINIDRAPTPRPMPNETSVPAPMPFERTEVSAPRRAASPGELSRQEASRAEIEPRAADVARFRPQANRNTRQSNPTARRSEVDRADTQVARRRRTRINRQSRESQDAPSRETQRVAQNDAVPLSPDSTARALARRNPRTRQSLNNPPVEAPVSPTPPRRTRQSDSTSTLTAPSVAIARTRPNARPMQASRRSRSRTDSTDSADSGATMPGRSFQRASSNEEAGTELAGGSASAANSADDGMPARQATGRAQLAANPAAEQIDGGEVGGAPNASREGDASESVADIAPSGNLGTMRRRRGAIPVRNRAERGDGGLGYTPSANIGVASRRASSESTVVHSTPSRFLNRRTAGPATLGSQSRTTAEPFARRGLRRTQQASNDPRRPSAATDLAIERGLQYLATIQLDDGRWSLQHNSADPSLSDRPARIVADTAATGMALLAFLGAGYDHFGDEYENEVARGLQFLTQSQQANGDLYIKQRSQVSSGVWFYSHGIAAMALCEAYGMTGDQSLQAPAQAALDFIIESQSPDRGGWRYEPRVSSDLSVSGWQIMALKSGQLAGLRVPASVLAKAKQLLQETESPQGSFVYNPWAARTEDSQNDRSPSTVMTSVGLLMRLYTGWTRDHPSIQQGAELLREQLAELKQPYVFAGLKNPNRDTYYWYNATQVMFHMQGEHWEQWNRRLYPMLAETQVQDGALAGSWHPTKPVPDRWGAYAGRVYVTALNLLSLEVYYRHLPLFDEGLAATP